jgi:aspartate ammonia-lyase
MKFRKEHDPLGELDVPADAYYGVQTMRAVSNFRISGLRAPADLVTATILIKKAAAEANASLGRLDAEIARAIIAAADEVLAGQFRDQFVVDVSGGSCTSTTMNANEAISRTARPRFSAAAGMLTSGFTRTITSTWVSRRTTSSRRRRGWPCC